MLEENDRNLIVAKIFRIQLSLRKSLRTLTFQSVVLHVYTFYFMMSFFIYEDKIKYFFVSFKK